jgi:hypothetical protein
LFVLSKKRQEWLKWGSSYWAKSGAAFLLRPANGYLIPITLLTVAIPLISISWTLAREASIRSTCALSSDYWDGEKGWAQAKLKALGTPDPISVVNPPYGRVDFFCEFYK